MTNLPNPQFANDKKMNDRIPEEIQPSFGRETVMEDVAVVDKSSKKGLFVAVSSVVLVVGAIGGLIFYLMQTGVITPNQKDELVKKMERTTESVGNSLTYKFKAQVMYVDGEVFQVVDTRKVEVIEEDVLEEDTTVLTSKDSKVVLVLDDGSTIRIGENSEVELVKMLPEEIVLDEKVGKLYARVNKDDNHLFIVKSGDVEVVSLGTAFSVEKEEGKDVNVKVFESKVKIRDVGLSDKDIEVGTEEEWSEGKDKSTKLAMGVVGKDEFFKWAMEEDDQLSMNNEQKESKKEKKEVEKKSEDSEEVEDKVEQGIDGRIKASATVKDGEGIVVSWDIDGFTPEYGFKVVWSENFGPVFPSRDGDHYHYHTDNGKRSDVITEATEFKTYHIRVCQYLNGKCGIYSNEVTAIMPSVAKNDDKSDDKSDESGEVKNINLKAVKEGDGKARLKWIVDGNSDMGFKVVWSNESNPVYPGNEYHYLDDSGKRDDEVDGLESGKTYHFRVCEYLGEKCGIYSNDASVGL